MKSDILIKRRVSKPLWVGKVQVGGDAPISVQSMTNTDTLDVQASINQIHAMIGAGADIVRVSVPSLEAADAFRKIRSAVTVPLVADIHFDYNIALKVMELGVDCLRINPGNIGKENKIKAVVDAAKYHNIPLRIGVNAGSLEKDIQRKYGEPNADALVESAMRQVAILEKYQLKRLSLMVDLITSASS